MPVLRSFLAPVALWFSTPIFSPATSDTWSTLVNINCDDPLCGFFAPLILCFSLSSGAGWWPSSTFFCPASSLCTHPHRFSIVPHVPPLLLCAVVDSCFRYATFPSQPRFCIGSSFFRTFFPSSSSSRLSHCPFSSASPLVVSCSFPSLLVGASRRLLPCLARFAPLAPLRPSFILLYVPWPLRSGLLSSLQLFTVSLFPLCRAPHFAIFYFLEASLVMRGCRYYMRITTFTPSRAHVFDTLSVISLFLSSHPVACLHFGSAAFFVQPFCLSPSFS